MPKGQLRNSIRRLRLDRGRMTQQALADLVGCSRQTILLLERGRYGPSLMLALRISKAFGRTVEEVFQLEGASAG